MCIKFGAEASKIVAAISNPAGKKPGTDAIVYGSTLTAVKARRSWLSFLLEILVNINGPVARLNPLAVGDNFPDVDGIALAAYTNAVNITSAYIHRYLFHDIAFVAYHEGDGLRHVAIPSVESKLLFAILLALVCNETNADAFLLPCRYCKDVSRYAEVQDETRAGCQTQEREAASEEGSNIGDRPDQKRSECALLIYDVCIILANLLRYCLLSV